MNFSTSSPVITDTTNWTRTTNDSYTNWTYTTEGTYTTTLTHTTGGTYATHRACTTPGTYTTPGTHTIHHEQVIQLKLWHVAVFVSIFAVAVVTALFASLRNVLGCAFRRICKAMKRGEEASGLLKAEQEVENQIKDVEDEIKTGGKNQEGSERPPTNENPQPGPATGNKETVNWL